MTNTIIKKMLGCAAASIMLGTLAIGTVFAAGTKNDNANNATEASAVQESTESPIFTWSGDYSKATATFINENNEMDVVECDVLVDADSDHVTYTAICSYNTTNGYQTFIDEKVEYYDEMNNTVSHTLVDDNSQIAFFKH